MARGKCKQEKMENQFSRTQMLIGHDAVERLKGCKVAVFGVGGVGGYAVEVLARSGVGGIDVFDADTVNITNLNRQVIALHSTLEEAKVDVIEKRIKDINPTCVVGKYKIFYLPENADEIDLKRYDYVVDCIDTITAKIELIRRCKQLDVPIISSMGAANKMDATAFRVADISKTTMDPLAKVIRKKLRALGIVGVKVVFSEEKPLKPMVMADTQGADVQTGDDEEDAKADEAKPKGKNSVPASNAFVPAAAGIVVGGEVVKDLIGWENSTRDDAKC